MAKSKKTAAKKGKRKERVVPAVIATERIFRLDMEIAIHNQADGTTSYSWAERTSRKGVGEDMAKALAEDLKRCGVGGRLVHLDGSPDGIIIEEWFGVDRLAAAKAKENAVQ